jgi:5'-nucleotidase
MTDRTMRARRTATRGARRVLVAGAVALTTFTVGPLGGADAVAPSASVAAEPFRILVTNDDGVGAPGIAAVVDAIQTIPGVEVHVVAPKTNQSGTSDSFTNGPLTIEPATTASGDAAVAVAGFPADTVWWAVQSGAVPRPDLIVSGINFGNNTGDLSELSGTVGAARAAARLGIPSIAASQGLSFDFSASAPIVRDVVAFLKPVFEAAPPALPAAIIKLEIPSCPSGAVRGGKRVPLAEVNTVASYALTSGSVTNGVWQPTVTTRDAFGADCLSTKTDVVDDVDAINNGFWALTVLDHNLGA